VLDIGELRRAGGAVEFAACCAEQAAQRWRFHGAPLEVTRHLMGDRT
jgi:hypothetical protein